MTERVNFEEQGVDGGIIFKCSNITVINLKTVVEYYSVCPAMCPVSSDMTGDTSSVATV